MKIRKLLAISVMVILVLAGSIATHRKIQAPVIAHSAEAHSVASVSVKPAATSIEFNQPAASILPTNPVPAALGRAETIADLLLLPSEFQQSAALYFLAARSNLSQIRQHLGDVYLFSDPNDRHAVRAVFYMRFSELDPRGMLAHFREFGQAESSHLLYYFFTCWAKFDLDQAIDRLDLLRTAPEKKSARDAIVNARLQIAPEELDELWARLDLGNIESYRPQHLAAIAKTDPFAAVLAALEIQNREIRFQALAQIAQVWARDDATAALSYAQNVGSDKEQSQFRRALLLEIANKDPETALALMSGLTNSENSSIISIAMSSLTNKDPQRALDLALAMESGKHRRQALYEVINSWVHVDPVAAANAIIQHADDGNWEYFGNSLAAQLARADPVTALALAEQLEGRHGSWLQNVLYTIARQDVSSALDYVQQMRPSQFRSEALSHILGMLARSDPSRALANLKLLPVGVVRYQATNQITNNWARSDPEAVFNWLLEQPPELQTQLLPNLAYQMVSADLDLAIGQIEMLTDVQVRSGWITNIVRDFSVQDPVAAADWIGQYSDDPGYSEWVSTIAERLVRKDPDAALDLLDGIESPHRYDRALVSLTQALASQNSVAAARWLSNLPRSQRTPGQFGNVAMHWFRVDPDAAIRWVQNLARADERDAALRVLAGNSHLKFSRRVRLLNQISNEQGRYDALQGALHEMVQYDLDGAHYLIRRAHVSPTMRQQLEQQFLPG